MPHENIYSDDSLFAILEKGHRVPADELDVGGDHEIYRRQVRVSWTSKEFVEVGVGEWTAADGVLNIGVFCTLDRKGVNQLIRVLRRARDRAFGPDA